ncbi:hypothetical protein [Streptomyces sp. HUAS ZL42]|uniref:Rv1733c family protein n=1 Tax=Streptomyces sp. HUAS ZL42 TaxID=3231715 RepID=UPI00345EFEDD
MGGTSSRKNRLWRWRSNPLRRRDDVIEAWIVLAVWAVVAVGGTLAGFVTAHAANDVFVRQRAERHASEAVVVADVPTPTAGAGRGTERMSAQVHWTAPDGSTRTGRTLVDAGQRAGTEVTVWLDARGELSTQPPSTTAAAWEAAVLGAAAALAATGVVVGVGAVARWRLDRRRIDEWGRQWDLVGPKWGHKTG